MNAKNSIAEDYGEARSVLKSKFSEGCPECKIPQQNWETFENTLYVECEYCGFTDWVFIEEKVEWEDY